MPGAHIRRGYAGPSPLVSPQSIFGADLIQWVRADLGIQIATGVSQWNDLSGNGAHYTQGTAGQQPAYLANGGPNNQPYVACDGANDGLTSSLTRPAPGTEPTFRWAICRQETWAGFDLLFGNSNNADPSFRNISFPNTTPNVNQNHTNNANANTAMTVATWFRFESVFGNSTADWLKIGATKSTGESAGNKAGDGVMTIALSSSGANAQIWVCELLHARVVPTMQQLSALDAYCVARYGAGLT